MKKENKIIFFPGLGEKPRDYVALSKYLTIANIDWSTDSYTPNIGNAKTED